MGDVIKDLKIKNLVNDYYKYSLYLSEFQNHIEDCYSKNIINIKDRNIYLKNINDSIRLLNSNYNDTIVEIYDNTNREQYQNIMVKIDNTKLTEIEQLNRINNMIGISNNIFNPYDKVNSILFKLGKNIGFPSIHTALSIIIDTEYKYLFDFDTNYILDFYNKIFTITQYDIINTASTQNNVYISEDTTENIMITLNYARLYIKYKKSFIVFYGYIKNDPMNIVIRTSQLCNNTIYKKKKDLETIIYNIDSIDENFAKSYIKHISLYDIVVYDNDKLTEKIKYDYQNYNKLIKMSFINLMKEFIKENMSPIISIKNMFDIIKLLLIGSEESINIAGILYNVVKKKKSTMEYSIADIIYNNLSYLSQTKLKKSTINIKSEFEKINSISIDDIDLKKQVLICKNMPDYVKKVAYDKIDEIKSSTDNHKQLTYVKMLLNFPWPSNEEDQFFINIGKNKNKSKTFLDNIINKLNNKVYGHDECKDSIKELLGKWICNPSSSGSAIGLMGPPGVGKTLIAKAIGESLDIPFVQITLGGQNDGDLLHGHSYTYSGSQPGMIVKKMIEAGSSRCIIYFDELDKACKKYDNNEIYNILIHITDPNTNTEFQDRFFQEIKFPLNKVLFIFSYNDASLIDPILMDRIKNIEVKPFRIIDKKIIIKQFIIKDMCKMVNFDENSIIVDDKAMDFIINHYTNESGVRELKRKFEKIFLRLNLARIYNKKKFSKNKPLKLTVELIEEYLGKNNIHIQYVHNEDLVGVINGLYATDSGHGGILPVEIFENYTNNDGKFILKMTGSQRRVMKESVITAFTVAMHCVNEITRTEYLTKNKFGFHIHTPASSATPKDGPSGGCAFAVAFISRILNKPIRHDIAITGEIELTGKIAKIGGLTYKLSGAKKSGVKTVFVPEENKDDIEQIKKDNNDLIDNDFKVVLVKNIKEILPYVLINYNIDQMVK